MCQCQVLTAASAEGVTNRNQQTDLRPRPKDLKSSKRRRGAHLRREEMGVGYVAAQGKALDHRGRVKECSRVG